MSKSAKRRARRQKTETDTVSVKETTKTASAPKSVASKPIAKAPATAVKPALSASTSEQKLPSTEPSPIVKAAAESTSVSTLTKLMNAMKLTKSSSPQPATESKMDDEKAYQTEMKPLQFGEVEKYVHHHYDTTASSAAKPTKDWSKRLATEYKEIAQNLPLMRDSSIFVRIHETKMAQTQFMITGPVGTPYAYGCYVYDIYFPPTYPQVPPLVNLMTTGKASVRFNPNLYNCGKVCLSLLGTWSGSATEMWQANKSTFLQVMVSIQSLVMGEPEPFFNEPGYTPSKGSKTYASQSENYTKNIQVQNIRWAIIDAIKTPPAGFETVVHTHMRLLKEPILKQARDWKVNNSSITDDLMKQLEEALATL